MKVFGKTHVLNLMFCDASYKNIARNRLYRSAILTAVGLAPALGEPKLSQNI